MLEGNDNSEELASAVLIIQKNQPPSSIPPPDPDTIFFLDYHIYPATKTPFVLWEDILQAFQDVVQVRHKARTLPFMKESGFRTYVRLLRLKLGCVIKDGEGLDYFLRRENTLYKERKASFILLPTNNSLEPRRIAAIPNAVLDIVLGNSLVTMDLTSPGSLQQESLSPTSQRGEGKGTDNKSIVSQEVSTTDSTRQHSADGPEDEAMDKYRNNDNPVFTPIPEEPQFIPKAEEPASDTISESTKITKDLSQLIIDANLGDNAAQVALGDRYREGDGVDQDYLTAMEWYLKAAAQGNADAQNNIGWLFDEGHGVPRDYTQAKGWYLRAAEQGHPAAQNNIGIIYGKGKGIPQDYSQTVDCNLKAAEQGYPTAQNNIGSMYGKGNGVLQDYSQAVGWYLKAADQGDANAQANVAILYAYGWGVPQDYSLAMDWYLKAADQGNSYAQYSIGVRYNHGQGVPQDNVEAMIWYLKAAEQGHAHAQYSIGCMYAAGHGTTRDYSQAAGWYLKAAEQGSADAQYEIGELFEKGQGVPQDIVKAKEWYQKAANQGISIAKKSLDVLERKGNLTQPHTLVGMSTNGQEVLLPLPTPTSNNRGFYPSAYSASASAGNTSQVIDNYTHVDDRPYFLRGNH